MHPNAARGYGTDVVLPVMSLRRGALTCLVSPKEWSGLTLSTVMDADLICYQFNRLDVEKCDFGHFLGLYSGNQLPAGRNLQAMLGTFWFAITGYDNDPRELNSIPEVRRFYAAFHQAALLVILLRPA